MPSPLLTHCFVSRGLAFCNSRCRLAHNNYVPPSRKIFSRAWSIRLIALKQSTSMETLGKMTDNVTATYPFLLPRLWWILTHGLSPWLRSMRVMSRVLKKKKKKKKLTQGHLRSTSTKTSLSLTSGNWWWCKYGYFLIRETILCTETGYLCSFPLQPGICGLYSTVLLWGDRHCTDYHLA